MKMYFGKYILVPVLGLAIVALPSCASTSSSTSTQGGVAQSPTASNEPAVTVDISAQNFRFDKSNISVPAGAEVTLVFDNKEAVPHNVAVYTTPAATDIIFRGDVITGPKTITYHFKAPMTPGVYFFRCDVHPNIMTGTFTVTGS